MSKLICEFCGSELNTKSSLNQHQKKAKYCLDRQKYRSRINETNDLIGGTLKEETSLLENPPSDFLIFRGADGYIDVTSLCKAGKKTFTSWNKLKKSKTFLECLSRDLKIPSDKLTEYTGRRTYAHPQVAINIAQWISPEFDIKVSKWLYQIMITGSFNFTSEKTSLELDRLSRQNRLYASKIVILEKKLLQRQERVNYPPNTIYVISTRDREKKGEYKIGKAKNLKNRLSVFNTSEEHIVYFYFSCRTITEMDILEKILHNHLEPQRIEPNREWFRGSVKFLTDVIESMAAKNGYI